MKAPTLRRSTASVPRTGPVQTRRTARVAVEHSPARARWEQEAVRAAKAAAVGSVVPQLTPAPAAAVPSGIGPGTPLPRPTRARLEHGFRADLCSARCSAPTIPVKAVTQTIGRVTPVKVAIDRSPWSVVGLMTLAACGSVNGSGSGSAPRLAADHVPSELRGLLPGVSTEADVLAAWPEAVAVRHQSLGGERSISLDGAPAIKIVRGDEQAWLVEVGGVHRVASLRLRTTRTCDAVLAEFGPTRSGPCTPTNRRPSPGEH